MKSKEIKRLERKLKRVDKKIKRIDLRIKIVDACPRGKFKRGRCQVEIPNKKRRRK